MRTEHERWASYFYPETYDPGSMQGTLRNLLGERDAAVLAAVEHAEVQDRQRELLSGEAVVPRSYDAAHVRAIHRHLFQDVYAWAGEYRTVNIFKGTPVGFADVESGQIDRYLGDVGRLVTAAPWAELTREEFAERAGTVVTPRDRWRSSAGAKWRPGIMGVPSGTRELASWSVWSRLAKSRDCCSAQAAREPVHPGRRNQRVSLGR